MNTYKALNKQKICSGNFCIVPIRMEDRYAIMQWRNEQICHLRQNKPLTKEEQDKYFITVISGLFDQNQPNQILFSYLKGSKCIGYGGLVHINWTDQNAEISFIIDTKLEKDNFESYWVNFLNLIERVGFCELGLKKIYTYAFDLRPKLYAALEKGAYVKEAVLLQHAFYEGKFIDVIIHSKINELPHLRNAQIYDTELTYKWAKDPIVRMYAFSKEMIALENHKIWYLNKIAAKDCEYYILIHKDKSIGSIRFDINQDGLAMVSYLIDPMFHGKGYGKIILEYGIDRVRFSKKKVKKIFGLVQQENTPSIKIFQKLGFQNTSRENRSLKYEKEFSKWK